MPDLVAQDVYVAPYRMLVTRLGDAQPIASRTTSALIGRRGPMYQQLHWTALSTDAGAGTASRRTGRPLERGRPFAWRQTSELEVCTCPERTADDAGIMPRREVVRTGIGGWRDGRLLVLEVSYVEVQSELVVHFDRHVQIRVDESLHVVELRAGAVEVAVQIGTSVDETPRLRSETAAPSAEKPFWKPVKMDPAPSTEIDRTASFMLVMPALISVSVVNHLAR
jgi:hypothetical protein